MRTTKIILAALGLALAATAQAEAPAKPDRVVVCAACHGENGVATQPMYPNLAGQQTSYIEHALHAYKSGERKNAIMAPQAAGLTEAEIKQLAAWFAAQPAKDYVPDVDQPAGKK
ncbi:MAG TPA: cytochrome c [Nevskia sp.]|jgi:cytochrome c553|nr:cytochrome c [Nevskia sp.]